MKVLFLLEKMAMCNESVYSTLLHLPEVELSLFHYDEGKEAQLHYEGEVDHKIKEYVRGHPNDVIIYDGPAEGKCRPSLETFDWLKTQAKTICVVNDGGCKGWWPALQSYKDNNSFHLVMNIDGCQEWPKREQDITCWPLLNPSYFHPKKHKKTFFGGIHSYSSPHRDKATKFLLDNTSFEMGNRSDQWGDYQKYADYLCDTLITINFPESGGGTPMMKFRVIEAGYAGCVLLEKKNPITSTYLKPGEDYIEYESIEEVPEIIRSLSFERISILSSNIRNYTTTYLNPVPIWRRRFEDLIS